MISSSHLVPSCLWQQKPAVVVFVSNIVFFLSVLKIEQFCDNDNCLNVLITK